MTLRLRSYTLAVALTAAAGLSPVAFAAGVDAQMPPGITESLSTLADQPATHTGFVLDRSEMQIAQGLLQQGGLDADRAAAALASISFDTYRYKEPAFYTPETMAQIVDRFHRAGWKHLVDGNQAAGERGPAAYRDHRRVAALYRRGHRPGHRAGARRRAT